MSVKEERVSYMQDQSSTQEQTKIEEKKPAISTSNPSEHEDIKQTIIRETQEAKDSFWSNFKEIRIKQEQLKDHEAKQRDNIESMIKSVTEEAQRSVAEISRNIIGHGSSIQLAEKFINPIQKVTTDEGETLEDTEKRIIKEIEEKQHPKDLRVSNTFQKVNATKMGQRIKLKKPKKLKKSEKHVTFTTLVSANPKISKKRQAKDKPHVMDNCMIDVEYDVPGEARNTMSYVKKERTLHPKAAIKAKNVDKNNK